MMWELWGLTLVIILIPASLISFVGEGADWSEESSSSDVAISFPLRETSLSLRNFFARASI